MPKWIKCSIRLPCKTQHYFTKRILSGLTIGFWESFNGHGAGFWDKEDIYGIEWSAKLTQISKQIGGCDCYHIRGKKSKLTFN